jgi:hypothetical protein
MITYGIAEQAGASNLRSRPSPLIHVHIIQYYELRCIYARSKERSSARETGIFVCLEVYYPLSYLPQSQDTKKKIMAYEITVHCLFVCLLAPTFFPLFSHFLLLARPSVRNMLQLYNCCLSHAVLVGSSLSHYYTWKVVPSLGILFFLCREVGYKERQLVMLY